MGIKPILGILLLLGIASASYSGNLTLNVSHGSTLDLSTTGKVINGSWFITFNFTPVAGTDYNFSYAVDGVWRVFPETGTVFHPFGAYSLGGGNTTGGSGNISGAGTLGNVAKFTGNGTIGNAKGVLTSDGYVEITKSDISELRLTNVAGSPIASLWAGAFDGGNLDLYDSFGGTVVHFGETDPYNYIDYTAYPVAYFGINTKTPETPLHVIGNATINGSLIFGDGTSMDTAASGSGGGGNITGSGEEGYIARWENSTNLISSQLYRNGTSLILGSTTTQNSGHPLEIWTSSGASQMALRTFTNSAAGANFRVMRGRGTPKAPLRLRANDVITGYNAFAYYAPNNTATAEVTATAANGAFQFLSQEDATSTAKGTYFRLNLAPVNSTTQVNRLMLNETFALFNATIAVYATDNASQRMCLNISQSGTVGAYKC